MPDFNFVPGVYRVDSDRLRLRGTTLWNTEKNYILKDGVPVVMQAGQTFAVYRVKYLQNGEWWAVVSPPEAANEHYCCLWDGKKQYAHLESPFPDNPFGELVSDERMAEAIEANTKAIEKLTEAVLRLANK